MTRSCGKEPGFAITVLLTIAIGIAATTTIFSVVDGVLWRRLPYPEPDRIVSVWPSFWFSNSSFEVLERDLDLENGAFVAIAGSSPRNARYRDADGERTVAGRRVTARFFDVLGPAMTAGRTFDPDANELGNERVTVVSHGFWQRELRGDESIVGETIILESGEHTLLGVLAPGYELFSPGIDVVLPKAFDRDSVRYRSDEMKAIGRLRPDATVEQARAELEAVVAGWRERYGLADGFGAGFTVVPLHESLVGDLRPTMLLLFGSVGLILLIAAANVVNLLLARGLGLRREFALRLALGAQPSRIVRQVLTESVLLALLGGAAGLLGSILAVRLVVASLPATTPRLAGVAVDGRVAAFATALALLTGCVVGALPALRLSATQRYSSLDGGSRTVAGGHRLRRTIVAAEIALGVTLLVGAGLLVKSFWQLHQVDPGIRDAGLLTFYVGAERGRLTDSDEAEVFHRQVRERLGALHGVTAVSTISQAPYNEDGGVVGCRAFDDAAANAANAVLCRWRAIGPDYFQVAGTPLLEGRAFDVDDQAGSEPVAVISRSTARALFPNDEALGKRIATGFEEAVAGALPWSTVVGIVADVRFLGLAEEPPLLVYRPYAQAGDINDAFGAYGSEYLVRAGPGSAPLEDVLAAVRGVDRFAVVSGFASMEALIADSVTDRRAVLVLISAFTIAAMLLSAIGIYGVTAHGVRSRSRELSIRVALGATRRDVLEEVVAGGLAIAIVGAFGGLALALGVGRFLGSFLYEVQTSDPWILASAALLAVAISLAAAWIPARRAAAADPAAALQAE